MKIPFESFSLINFPIPCNRQQLSSLLKPTVERNQRNLNENKHRRTILNICLVTTQSFNEGSLDARTWKHSLSGSAVRGYHVFQDLFKPSIGEKLVGKQEFNNTIDKHAVKEVKGDQPVGHLPCKFSQIVWYFLAHSG